MMNRLLSNLLLGLLALLVLPLAAAAQQDTTGTGTLTGTVTDAETEETIPGANVLVAGTSLGAATGVDGRFEIEGVPTGAQTLQVTFTGYETNEMEVTVGAGETVRRDIALSPAVAELETVTVQGYRTQQQTAEVTGAASNVSGATVEEANIQNTSEALQGRASGVRVTSTSGQPGAAFEVNIRGQGSIIGGTQPLYIVDGVQINTSDISNEANLSALVGVDPSDIESVEVLKDAAATSIYGARAANGVVLIETKDGVAGETQVDFTAQAGAVTPLRSYDILSASEWAEYTFMEAENAGTSREAIANSYGLPSTNPAEITGPNWYDASTRTGFTQGYDLSVSGGNESTRFRLSGTYERDRGQVIHSFLNQGGLRVNLDHDVTGNLTVGSKVNLTTISTRGTISGGAFINSPFWAAYLIRPHLQIYNFDENGERTGYNLDLAGGGAFDRNIVAQEDYNDSPTDANQIQGNVTANWQIAPWLFARTLVGLNHTDLAEKDRRDQRLPNNADVGGSAFVSNTRELETNVSQTFNYSFTPGPEDTHSLSGLLGAEYRRSYRKFTGADGEGFPLYQFENLDNAANPVGVDEFETETRFLGFFGEAEYGYDDRYTGRATIRYDGSSRFGADQRFGVFGSVGAAWSISEEAFMEDVGFVDNLTLRASYGVLGNSDFGDAFAGEPFDGNFVARQLIGGGGEYLGQPAVAPSSIGNADLTWEESQQTNVGFDYALFRSRVYGSFNVYRTDTDQLLFPRSLPVESGFESFISNVGEIRNEGIEVDVNTINIDAGDFRWDTNFNISFQRSEVLSLFGDREEVRDGTQPGGDLYRVGEPLAQYEQVPWAGVNPANGRPLYLDEDGNLTYTVGGPDAEQTYGNALADFFGGFGNTLSYKGLTLTAFFQFDYGRTTFNNDRYFIDGNFTFNHTSGVLENYWQEPGDIAGRPLPYLGVRPGGSGYGTGYFNSSRFMENASYIRLKQLRLSYTLPSSLLGAAGVNSASVFVNGSNLWTITDYTGLDPEQVGTAIGQYPNNRRYTAGIRLQL